MTILSQLTKVLELQKFCNVSWNGKKFMKCEYGGIWKEAVVVASRIHPCTSLEEFWQRPQLRLQPVAHELKSDMLPLD
jgi:hypothetical protein